MHLFAAPPNTDMYRRNRYVSTKYIFTLFIVSSLHIRAYCVRLKVGCAVDEAKGCVEVSKHAIPTGTCSQPGGQEKS